jgi:hypothetical protein
LIDLSINLEQVGRKRAPATARLFKALGRCPVDRLAIRSNDAPRR